ncbi:MAG: hypothetical protein M1827_001919 [Pycnora praestabilis]|nr:MAG: hypothetical protein M1827_001919 [Pycnora praestabilis]
MEMNYDENTLHQLEQELNTEILPGTEVMVDVGTHHFVKSSASSDRVLVPQPSDDPSDPLNWKPWWKFSTLTCATAISFCQGFGPLALAPMFPQLIEAFDSTLTDVVQFTGVAILVLGFSNFIWVPLSTSFGRRPVLLASTIICLGSCIWRAKATTYSSFMGACVLNGIGAGPAETIQPAVIADVMFLHDRGKYNTLYFAFYFGSLAAGPIIGGAMAQYSTWQNFWWLNVAMHTTVLLMISFGFPETKWHRVHPDEILGIGANQSPSPLSREEVGFKSVEAASDVEKRSPLNNMPDLSHAATAQRDPFLGKGTPSKAQWRLYQPNAHPFKSIAIDLWTPWKLFAFPIVEFASFVVSWSASSFLTLNLVQSQAFAAPPYNFSSISIGFMNFAILIGQLIGLVTAGPLSDWISMRATRRNKGIREPEMRLPTMIPYVLIMILGNFIVAFGWQQAWNWKVIVIIGWTCAGIQVAALPAIVSTYAVDSYKPVSGSIFVSITVNKNVWGYGFSKFITPWIISSGYVPPIMTNMSLITLWCLFGFVFFFLGKTFRRWTKNSNVHQM